MYVLLSSMTGGNTRELIITIYTILHYYSSYGLTTEHLSWNILSQMAYQQNYNSLSYKIMQKKTLVSKKVILPKKKKTKGN